MPGKFQKSVFMLKKFWKDVRRDRQIYELAEDIHSPELREYYFLITEEQMLAGHSQNFHFDAQGIPIIPTYIDVEERKLIYYPISIGQYGLAIWHTYLETGEEKHKKRFLSIANWFMENREEDPKLGAYWWTGVDKPAYQIKSPWKSAFAQARGINILLRAYQLTGEEIYLEVAERALWPFLFAVSEGGVVAFVEEGPFYEEYPSHVPVLVLNGMIFALMGVYDFVRVHPDHEIARQIFQKGVDTLAHILPRYDMGFWSKYSLCEADFHPEVDPATIGYHYLHIIQLEFLHRLMGQEIFREYAQKWQEYVTWRNIARMYWIKYRTLKKMNRL